MNMTGDEKRERHTRAHPCPICGGHDALHRGQAKRCHGYTVTFEPGKKVAYCAREESEMAHPSAGDLWGHQLKQPSLPVRPPRVTAPRGNGRDAEPTKLLRVAEYVYVDRQAEPLSAKIRYEPKSFSWTNGNPHVLYELPLIVEAETVHLHEGEKAADALRQILPSDQASTCWPAWSLRQLPELLEPLRGHDVIVWVDRDEAGLGYARALEPILAGIAKSVTFMQSATTGHSDDAYDHVAAGYTYDEGVPLEILAEDDPDDSNTEDVRLLVQLASDVTVTPIEWIWTGYLPRKKLIVFDGLPGVAKSTIMTDISARVTSGKPMPDGAQGIHGNVVMVSYEDDPADTIVPRFLAAGGDPDKLYLLDSVQTSEGLDFLCVPDHVAALERLVFETKADLVVVDPLMAALGPKVKTGIDHDVRRALVPLTALAHNTGAAVVIVRHLNKAAKITDPILRGGGSIGIIGAARHALMAGCDPDDPDRRVLAITKSNIGRDDVSSLSYQVVEDPKYHVSAITWLGSSDRSARDLLEADAGNESRGARDEATSILAEYLVDGPQLADDCRKYAREAGISSRTLDRAKKSAGVKSQPITGEDGKRHWQWELTSRKDANRGY